MATIGEMVSVLAEAVGVPEESVAQISRILRDAGMIKSGGRGRSAAKMTSDDCSSLLISMMISDQLKKSPEYVESSRLLRKIDRANDGIHLGDNFFYSLSRLINNLSDGSFYAEHECKGLDIDISVSLDRPIRKGNISVGTGRSFGFCKSIFNENYYIGSYEITSDRDHISFLRFNPPLRIEATVSELVILRLSDLLKT